MILASNAFCSLFLAPFGLTARSLILTDNGIEVQRSGTKLIPFLEISASPQSKVGLLSSTVIINSDDGSTATLRGANKHAAKSFVAASDKAWRDFNRVALDAANEQIERLLHQLRKLGNPRSYPSACKVQPLLEEAKELNSRLIKKLRTDAIEEERINRLAPIRDFVAKPEFLRDASIAKFVEEELARWKDFFDTVESKPLLLSNDSQSL